MRPDLALRSNGEAIISIHAPREGCDEEDTAWMIGRYISIHAPREGCDALAQMLLPAIKNFNPRTP